MRVSYGIKNGSWHDFEISAHSESKPILPDTDDEASAVDVTAEVAAVAAGEATDDDFAAAAAVAAATESRMN